MSDLGNPALIKTNELPALSNPAAVGDLMAVPWTSFYPWVN
jgi:hypothetical protein